MTFTIQLKPADRSFSVEHDEAILPAAIRQGIGLPYGCRDGACGSCKSRLIAGRVIHGAHQHKALSLADRLDTDADKGEQPRETHTPKKLKHAMNARLDAARNPNHGGGVGLGLSIAADVARSHGGVLRLGESPALGGLQAELVLGRTIAYGVR
jgi:ferredoxin